jgi:uncharacterized membrane protein YhaH (DUF805 family)
MSVAFRGVSAPSAVDGLRYWSILLLIAAGQGLAIILATSFAGLGAAALLSANPAIVVAEMLLVAVLLWPAVWLAIHRLYDHKTPGWLSLPAILLAALILMSTAFGRPFSIPVSTPIVHLFPLALIVLVSACVIVEWFGVGRHETAEPAPAQGADIQMPLAA